MSSKRLRADLHTWDQPLGDLIDQFVQTCGVQAKFGVWSQMIDHVLAPLGGRQPIGENNCACAACQADRAALVEPYT